jgi:hypothetical protein
VYYFILKNVDHLNYGRTNHLVRSSWLHTIANTSNQTVCYPFFIKPKLHIDYNQDNYDLCVQEADMPFGNKRQFLKVIIRNTGWPIAENCEASLTLEKTTNTIRPPSTEARRLIWDNNQEYRTIGARNGDAVLYIVFSDSSFVNPQANEVDILSDDKKTYAIVSTIRSFGNINASRIPFVQDSIGIGDTNFKLVVKSLNRGYIEQRFKVHVTTNWHELSMELI